MSASRLLLASLVLVAAGCHSDRELDDYARAWADAVCERRSACGCAPTDCVEAQRESFVERWEADDEDDLPDPTCFDERIEAIEDLTCDAIEGGDPFAWERAACPLKPNFRGPGQRCEVPEPGGTLRGSCQAGLVCDAVTEACVSPVPAPGLNQACLRSGDPHADDWLCAAGLTCDAASGSCIVPPSGAEPMREPDPPLACRLDVF